MTSVMSQTRLMDPYRWAGLRIGLFGGSFNPIHGGHIHVARLALRKLDLDAVWWMVTPQNPLKSGKENTPYDKRFAQVEDALAPFPRQIPTHLEAQLNTQYTYDTVMELRTRFPLTDFLWICGNDNAQIFHHWDRWQDFLKAMPITFIARPPAHTLIRQIPLRMQAEIPQIHVQNGITANLKKPGIFWLMSTKMLDISSTRIRKRI